MSSIERTEAAGSPRERAEVEYRKAINAVNLGRIPEALEGLRNALRQDGQHSASRQLLVKLLLEAKRQEEAIQVLRDGLLEQPAHNGWAMTLARLQIDRGDLAGAWQTLDHASPAAGNNADFQGFAAHVLQRLGRQKEAAERYQAATRLSPGEGRWWLGLGLSLENEGRSTEAREAFLRAKQCANLSAELGAMVEQKLR
jgi:MSHA biogenesis protein MshN